MTKKSQKIVSEFRKDLVSGEWILVSSLRRFRPHYIKSQQKQIKTPKNKCPFENPQKSGNPAPVLWYPRPGSASEDFNDWFIQVIPNKYPLFLNSKICPQNEFYGPYEKISGNGFHEVIVFRDHNKDLEKMSESEIEIILRAYRDRYKMIENENCVEYILIFHNHGALAGASVDHPHSQLVAMPIVPPDVSRSINGALSFFEQNKKCVYCTMLEWEQSEKKRIVYENEKFIAFCPYASRVPYEVRIFPKEHSSDFEEIPDKDLAYLADVFGTMLRRLSKLLKNPDYNFYIHTASSRVKKAPYYHWHIEILPRTYKWAGLELGTGIEVVSVPPEVASKELRKSK